MSTPTWITPAGFLGTATERVLTEFTLVSNNATTFSIISGKLPGGMKLSNTGTISGVPFSVGETIISQFVVRAENTNGITDRTFIINTEGPTAPAWVTPEGYLVLGLGRQPYIINRQYIDYQFNALYDALPAGQQLRYYIVDGDGALPNGVALSESGRLIGYVKDTLALTADAAVSGGYDKELYDGFPYDHAILQNGNVVAQRPRYLAKIYQFLITVTDGVASSKRLFRIKVEDPSSFRVDTTLIDVDTILYGADASYLITPQWVTPADLGYIRANGNQIIKLSIYDSYPNTGTTEYNWDAPTLNQDGTASRHPPNFHLESTTGLLYAKLPYQPIYSETYKFTIRIIKTDTVSNTTSYRDKTFTLIIKGDVESTLEFVSNSDLGTLYVGRQSELAVVAKHTIEVLTIKYNIVAGSLPTGLTMAIDGTIIGKIAYNSQTYFDKSYGFGAFTLDNGLTTIDKLYNFTVQATDAYQTSILEKDFFIQVDETSNAKYTEMYIRPFFSSSQRDMYSEFITNDYTFTNSMLYRPLDSKFGVQLDIKFVLEHGIEELNLSEYALAFTDDFKRQQLYFGDIKTAVSKDAKNNVIYEVVYVEILDQSSIGIDKIKNILDTTFNTDEYTLPNWMRSIQSIYGSPIRFVKSVPICYALPGMSDIIVKRIKLSGFDFKSLNFTADRLLINETSDNLNTKYLPFATTP